LYFQPLVIHKNSVDDLPEIASLVNEEKPPREYEVELYPASSIRHLMFIPINLKQVTLLKLKRC